MRGDRNRTEQTRIKVRMFILLFSVLRVMLTKTEDCSELLIPSFCKPLKVLRIVCFPLPPSNARFLDRRC
jgi:hypothetical protein